jgi:hypothetical protein
MKTKKLFIATMLLIAVCIVSTHAQTTKSHSIETNLLWPFIPEINILSIKYMPVIYRGEKQYTELSTGIFLSRSENTEDAALEQSIGITLGARHYWYKQWHTEVITHLLSSKEDGNLVDGRNYKGFQMLLEAYVGYKFNFKSDKKANFYLIPQVGYGGFLVSNLGPSKDPVSSFPAASILLGVSF